MKLEAKEDPDNLIRIKPTTIIESEEGFNIGKNTYIGHFGFIDASNKVTIKEGCQISNNVSIYTHSSHMSIRLYGKQYTFNSDLIGYKKGSVYIDKYTFVGCNVLIQPNTRIGKGCIVKAFSNVKGEFPDFSIIDGNPAKVIGSTKDLDKPYLDEHEILNQYYNEWA